MSARNKTIPLEEILLRYVVDQQTGCWNWIGSLRNGYGQLTYKQVSYSAHRFFYAHMVGSIVDGCSILHHCDNRKCVNPLHLYQGDAVDNRRDMLERKRWNHPFAARTHCFAGHKYTDGSYRIARDGSRYCRVCNKNHKRRYRAERKQA